MLFTPFEVTLNAHHQHFAISWNKQTFYIQDAFGCS